MSVYKECSQARVRGHFSGRGSVTVTQVSGDPRGREEILDNFTMLTASSYKSRRLRFIQLEKSGFVVPVLAETLAVLAHHSEVESGDLYRTG